MYFHYLKENIFWIEVSRKKIFNFENRSTGTGLTTFRPFSGPAGPGLNNDWHALHTGTGEWCCRFSRNIAKVAPKLFILFKKYAILGSTYPKLILILFWKKPHCRGAMACSGSGSRQQVHRRSTSQCPASIFQISVPKQERKTPILMQREQRGWLANSASFSKTK